MKKAFSLLLLTVMIASCGTNEDEGKGDSGKFNLDLQEINLPTNPVEEKDNQRTATFTAPAAWTISVASTATRANLDWLQVEPMSGAAGTASIKISTKPNYVSDQRGATITIHCGSETANITLSQPKQKVFRFLEEKGNYTLNVDGRGGYYCISLLTNEPYHITALSDGDQWIVTKPTLPADVIQPKDSIIEGLKVKREWFYIKPDTIGYNGRNGVIGFDGPDNNTIAVSVNQGKLNGLKVEKDYISILATQETPVSFLVFANADWEVIIPAEAQGWLKWVQTPPSKALTSYRAYLQADKNDKFDYRYTTIEVKLVGDTVRRLVHVQQDYREELRLIYDESTEKVIAHTGGEFDIEVFTGYPRYELKIEPDNDWIKAVKVGPTAPYTEKWRITVSPNMTNDTRSFGVSAIGYTPYTEYLRTSENRLSVVQQWDQTRMQIKLFYNNSSDGTQPLRLPYTASSFEVEVLVGEGFSAHRLSFLAPDNKIVDWLTATKGEETAPKRYKWTINVPANNSNQDRGCRLVAIGISSRGEVFSNEIHLGQTWNFPLPPGNR